MVHGNFVDVLTDPNGSAGKWATEWLPRRIRAAAITAPTCSAFSDPHPHPTTTTPEKKESRKNGGKIISKPKIQIKVSHTLRRKRCDNSNRIHPSESNQASANPPIPLPCSRLPRFRSEALRIWARFRGLGFGRLRIAGPRGG